MPEGFKKSYIKYLAILKQDSGTKTPLWSKENKLKHIQIN